MEKYQPKSLSEIVGQQTEKSPMKKLIYFLTNWHTWHATPSTNKRKRTDTVTSNDPSKFKAVLLTGPPGVGKYFDYLQLDLLEYISGKTTTAQLVCKALNMPFIEQNASDNRSRTAMEKLELNSAYLTDENATMNKHVRRRINLPFTLILLLGVNYG